MVKLSRLRAVRERLALTQEELADKAGVSRLTVSRIESGRVEPYPKTIRRLAEVLDVKPSDLMDPLD